MSDADNNFGGSLGLDFRKWWRHVQPVAQLVEHRVVTREVVSSTLAGPTLMVLK